VPFSAVEVEVEFDLPQLSPSPQSNPCTAVVTPDDWRIDALITAWADIPADDGDVDVDVDLDDEYDEYDEDEYSQHGHAFEYEATPALEHYASSPLASPASPSEATPYPLLPLKPNTMAMPKAMHILKSQMPPTPSGRPWHWNASPGEPVFWPVPPL
jgi:hypothetical protein